jgi:hypothetical protein
MTRGFPILTVSIPSFLDYGVIAFIARSHLFRKSANFQPRGWLRVNDVNTPKRTFSAGTGFQASQVAFSHRIVTCTPVPITNRDKSRERFLQERQSAMISNRSHQRTAIHISITTHPRLTKQEVTGGRSTSHVPSNGLHYTSSIPCAVWLC